MQEDKIDLVMWTKNGESSLPRVLRQVDEVIPFESVFNKIMIDDHSTDQTVKIAKDFNWQVYPNPARGISSGANEALRRVRSERFVSVEQDVVLAKDWWEKIPPLLAGEKVVAASGVRIPDKPDTLRLLEEYAVDRYYQKMLSNPAYRYGKTIDNTIYRTALLGGMGGFPKLTINAGIDATLVKQINDAGYVWKVDFTVRSIHIRRGILDELRHGYWYGTEATALDRVLEEPSSALTSTLARAAFSPFRGLSIAYKKRCWQIAFVYPVIRVTIFIGVLVGRLSKKLSIDFANNQN